MDTNVKPKHHNTSKNSINSFKDYNKSGKRGKQHVVVYDAIAKHQPVNSRQLAKITGVERANICRIVFDAINTADPLIKKINLVCRVTGKQTSHYCLIDFEITEPGR